MEGVRIYLRVGFSIQSKKGSKMRPKIFCVGIFRKIRTSKSALKLRFVHEKRLTLFEVRLFSVGQKVLQIWIKKNEKKLSKT